MKVIELLNKKANKEEVPNRIKYQNKIYHYRGDDYSTFDEDWLFSENYTNKTAWLYEFLNDEVEIIEEDKKIEKIDIGKMLQTKKWKRDKKTYQTINKLIDEVNKLKGDKNEK